MRLGHEGVDWGIWQKETSGSVEGLLEQRPKLALAQQQGVYWHGEHEEGHREAPTP